MCIFYEMHFLNDTLLLMCLCNNVLTTRSTCVGPRSSKDNQKYLMGNPMMLPYRVVIFLGDTMGVSIIINVDNRRSDKQHSTVKCQQ